MTFLAVAITLMLPTGAAADWTHKGQGKLSENAEVTFSGNVTLNTEVGNVVCAATISTTLTGSSTAGHVNSFTVSEPSKCDLTESLGSACGTNGLTKVEKTGTWGLTAETETIAMSSIDLHFKFSGCFIPALQVKGSATLSLSTPTAIASVTLEGSQTLYNALEEEAGSASLSGTLSASPSGTYGVKPDTAPTKWLMENEPLAEDGEMTLSGNLSFSGSVGSVECPVSAALSLTAGEIEDGEAEGEIESLTVAEPSKCDVTGTLGTLCGTNSVSEVKQGEGAWGLSTNEADISVLGLNLDYKFKSCAVPSLRLEGDATLTVDDPVEISETTAGGSPSLYNAAEEKIGTAELAGSQTASPEGTFGIKEGGIAPPCEAEGEPTEELEWLHDGERLVGPCTEEFTGRLPLLREVIYDFSCEIRFVAELYGNETSIGEFEILTGTCGGEGIFEGCILTEAEFSGPTLSLTEETLDINSFYMTFELEECFIPFVALAAESLAAVPNEVTAISSLALFGTIETAHSFGGGPFELEGEYELTPAEPETFGIS